MRENLLIILIAGGKNIWQQYLACQKHWQQYLTTIFGFSGGSVVKHPPPIKEMQVQSLGREDLLEKEMAMHSSNLDQETPWTEEPGRLQSSGLKRHDLVTRKHLKFHLLKKNLSNYTPSKVWIKGSNPTMVLFSSYPHHHLSLVFSMVAILTDMRWYHIMAFCLYFPSVQWYWASFHVPVGHLLSSLERCLISSVLVWLLRGFWLLSYVSSLYILDIKPVSHIC